MAGVPPYHHLPILVFLCALSACATEQKWQASDVGVPPDIVAREISPELARHVQVEDIPWIPAPSHLRTCCAFGTRLRVRLMSMLVPGLELANVIGLEDLGPHNYDNGTLVFEASRPGGAIVTNENNGLVYTCRGGFIDTAHVRDWADWTLFLRTRIGRTLESGLLIELPPEGGRRRLTTKALSSDALEGHDRRDITVPMAQWVAFQLSVWHEIATWYGWSALAFFPEEASAFSPEDLYSNLLGIKLAGALVYQYAVTSEASYNENMGSALRMLLARLGAVPGDMGSRAARAVDGLWWDSRVPLPAKGLVTRRNLEIGTLVKPWLVQQAPVSNDDKAAIEALCGGPQGITLRNPSTCVTGKAFEDYAEIEIEVAESLAARGFPFPRSDSRKVTQRDFPDILDKIREQNAAEFGPHADRPD